MIVSTVPIWAVDVFGSVLMIGLSIACLRLAMQLRSRDRTNVIWAYLLWVSYALTLFAVSRSVGHILKQYLVMTGRSELWAPIRPVSGALNSFSFLIVASVTLFFQRTWSIYQGILNDKKELQSIRDELLYVNQNLEDLVAERTRSLARSEHRYRRIFESSKDMILVVDADGAIVDINPIGHVILGWNDGGPPLVGRPFRRLFSDERAWDRIHRILNTETSFFNEEADLRREDGTDFPALITGSADRDSDGGSNTLHFLIKDIEQRRLMEKQMAQADKLASIGEFSAGIAHEINNPLGIILGYTQLMMRGEEKDSERYQDLKTIEKHVRSCKAIVEDLLNFARTSSPDRHTVHLHEVMDDLVDFIQHHSKTDRLVVEKDYAPDMPPLTADEKRIRQVLMNLIMNAMHAVDDDGTIRLETRYDKEREVAVIRVEDDGHGIEPQNLSRIFDPFFTTKPTGEGTGLGLSVSYGIVKNHGGDIRVNSIPNKGTVFTVLLPVGRQERPEPVGQSPKERQTPKL